MILLDLNPGILYNLGNTIPEYDKKNSSKYDRKPIIQG